MSFKTFNLPAIGTVSIYKRRGAKAMKLSITHDNQIRVTLPLWVPYKVGVDFVYAKAAWIATKQTPTILLEPGSHIGKAHQLKFVHETGRQKIATRIAGSEVRVLLPNQTEWRSPAAQAAAKAASKRALKNQADSLLPKRLRTLAEQHGFSYRSVSVKHMKSRWGSCSSQQDIILNTYLMQLPWHLIDYVMLHELVHTRIMAHGDTFWNELGRFVTEIPTIRKTMRQHRPTVISQQY
ncbi:MAG: hypothetical protein NVS1B7_7100 [Candidatus Saccharimonadales bacterium]